MLTRTSQQRETVTVNPSIVIETVAQHAVAKNRSLPLRYVDYVDKSANDSRWLCHDFA
jgi:hypothetical protein